MSRLLLNISMALDSLRAGPDDLHGRELVRTVATPMVTRLKYARR